GEFTSAWNEVERRQVTGWKDMGGKTTGAKATGTKDNQETGGKGDMLMGKKEMDNLLPSDTTAGQTINPHLQSVTARKPRFGGCNGKQLQAGHHSIKGILNMK
ncbi:hypothetical protein LSAT2_028374, partial [Lamellibrachia satsuma]